MRKQEIIISENLEDSLKRAIEACPHDRLFVLTDETTHRKCLPLIEGFPCLHQAEHIVIGATDEHKTIESLAAVWTELSNRGGTRHSLMINVGGGMITDLGGFAAATFKRGIQYINIPTTLLAMVDASVGGKTGINFNGLKNEVGVFAPASSVLLDTEFLKTLDRENICSGYAEMLKHGLISTEENWAELLRFDLDSIDYALLQRLVAKSVSIKEHIVGEDPYEKGIRKALNLGHTAGHCFRKPGTGGEPHRAARICRGVGTDMRTLPEQPAHRIPQRQTTADHRLHQNELRHIRIRLQGIRTPVCLHDARQEEYGRKH